MMQENDDLNISHEDQATNSRSEDIESHPVSTSEAEIRAISKAYIEAMSQFLTEAQVQKNQKIEFEQICEQAQQMLDELLLCFETQEDLNYVLEQLKLNQVKGHSKGVLLFALAEKQLLHHDDEKIIRRTDLTLQILFDLEAYDLTSEQSVESVKDSDEQVLLPLVIGIAYPAFLTSLQNNPLLKINDLEDIMKLPEEKQIYCFQESMKWVTKHLRYQFTEAVLDRNQLQRLPIIFIGQSKKETENILTKLSEVSGLSQEQLENQWFYHGQSLGSKDCLIFFGQIDQRIFLHEYHHARYTGLHLCNENIAPQMGNSLDEAMTDMLANQQLNRVETKRDPYYLDVQIYRLLMKINPEIFDRFATFYRDNQPDDEKTLLKLLVSTFDLETILRIYTTTPEPQYYERGNENFIIYTPRQTVEYLENLINTSQASLDLP